MVKLLREPIDVTPETFTVSVTTTDGKTDVHKNVTSFGPVQSDLLSIAMLDGKSVIYPLTSNVRKYSYKKV